MRRKWFSCLIIQCKSLPDCLYISIIPLLICRLDNLRCIYFAQRGARRPYCSLPASLPCRVFRIVYELQKEGLHQSKESSGFLSLGLRHEGWPHRKTYTKEGCAMFW